MYKHMILIMATVRKWRGKICLAFLFCVSLFDQTLAKEVTFLWIQEFLKLNELVESH